MRFCYKYQYFKICHTKGHNFLSYVFAKYAAKWGLIPTVEFNDIAEEAIQRDASLIAKHKHVLVKDGVFVSMISSSSTKPKLSTFFLRCSYSQEDERLYRGKADDELRLGVHIRRGDYKTWHNGKYYLKMLTTRIIFCNFSLSFPTKDYGIHLQQ